MCLPLIIKGSLARQTHSTSWDSLASIAAGRRFVPLKSYPKRAAGHLSGAMDTSDESRIEARHRIQFGFTDEQEQFRSAIRRFLNDRSPTTEVRRLMGTAEGYDPEVWRRLSQDLALPGIHIPEQYGGAGFG